MTNTLLPVLLFTGFSTGSSLHDERLNKADRINVEIKIKWFINFLKTEFNQKRVAPSGHRSVNHIHIICIKQVIEAPVHVEPEF